MFTSTIIRLAVNLSHEDPAVQQRARALLAAITGAKTADDPRDGIADGCAALGGAPATTRTIMATLAEPFDAVRMAVAITRMDTAALDVVVRVLAALGRNGTNRDPEALVRDIGQLGAEDRSLLERVNKALQSAPLPPAGGRTKTKPKPKPKPATMPVSRPVETQAQQRDPHRNPATDPKPTPWTGFSGGQPPRP